MNETEAGLVEFERSAWRQRDWFPAILSFTSRRLFLPLLRFWDGARSRGVAGRVWGALVFYPLFVVAFIIWILVALSVFAMTPILFLFRRREKT